jgi:hypothetical protein
MSSFLHLGTHWFLWAFLLAACCFACYEIMLTTLWLPQKKSQLANVQSSKLGSSGSSGISGTSEFDSNSRALGNIPVATPSGNARQRRLIRRISKHRRIA